MKILIAALAGLVLASPAQASSLRQLDPAATLARAKAVFDGDPLHPTHEATPALRDLALVLDRLSPAAKREASALLDRPDDPAGARGGLVRYDVPSTNLCTEHFCVHYVRSTVDAPPLIDVDIDGRPDWVETTASVLESIWQKEVDEYGFKPPRGDLPLANHGPDARFDVYLAEIVDRGVLGFCAPEPPPNYRFWDVPGYCVLDNDYSPAQIGAPGLGGRAELELTAVHEFFHAIQFGYDFADDIWLLEGTATWMEDAVYDQLNEPYRRFPYSPLRQPDIPLDSASSTEPYQYGSWVFWRFLEEFLARNASRIDPSVIRRVWELADGSPGGPDMYSLEAVIATLGEHGIGFRPAFRSFAVANFMPSRFYREGRTWPGAPVLRTTVLKQGAASTRRTVPLDHLTSAYVSFVPGAGLRRNARLSLSVALGPLLTGPEAAAIVFRRSGPPVVRPISLSLSGSGRITLPFGRGSVRRVVLVLVNASNRYACGSIASPYSCRGRPRDDDSPYRYTARAR